MQAKDLDRNILGYCLKDKVYLARIASSITNEYFTPEFKKFAGAVLTFYKRYKKVITWSIFEDALTKKKAPLEKVLQYQRLYDSIISGTYKEEEFDYHYEEFRKKYWSELLITALGRKNTTGGAIDLLVDQQNPLAAWDKIRGVGLTIEASRAGEEIKRGDIKESTGERLDKYEYVKENPEEGFGLKTGFHPLDEATKGLKGGEILIIAGRPGSGKSISSLVIGKNIFKDGKNVLLISIEMPKEQYELRFDASYTGLETDKIELGTLDEKEEEHYKGCLKEIREKDNWFYTIDTFRCTPLTVEAEIEMALQRFAPDVVIIDYLGIMKDDEEQPSDNAEQAQIIYKIRMIARKYFIPFIIPVQLNRDLKKRKGTERLSRSDVIGQTADVVIQIEEKDETDEVAKLDNNMIFFISKNRKGKAGEPFTMYYNPATMTIEDRDSEITSQFEDLD